MATKYNLIPTCVPAMEDTIGIRLSHSEVMEAMRKLVDVENPGSWDTTWKAGLTPWDAGEIQPSLKEAIESGSDGIQWPKQGTALVPGCGSGHDVVYLASALGLKVIGLDTSQTAVDKAIASTLDNPRSRVGAQFVIADFFQYEPDELFTLIYDYTFFVAIPPSRRDEWGKKMAALITPGGYLITLVFPIDPPTDVGPPFYVRPEHYNEPLSAAFEKIIDRDPTNPASTHVGRERLMVWRRTY